MKAKLSDLKVKSITTPGRHPDGGGLVLNVSAAGTKAWLYRYRDRRTGKVRDMGLGSVDAVTLAHARRKAAEARALLADDLDPIEERQRRRDEAKVALARRMTFGQCVEQYIASHGSGWRNPKHRAQWQSTLKTHGNLLWDLPVAQVDTGLVVKALEPIWTDLTETATRVRQRIEAVLDWATVRGYRSGENPARWRGHLDKLLPKPGKLKAVQHQPAMAYADVPEFMLELRQRPGLSCRLLELVILTACRVGEAAAARWEEFDLQAGRWTIPAGRMKSGKEHTVALADDAVQMLAALPRDDTGFVFPGIKGRSMNPESARKLLQVDMGRTGATVHGFRSSFRDWAAEQTSFPHEVVEAALGHAVDDKVVKAYRRTDFFDKRARLMDAWARYLAKPVRKKDTSNVTPIGKAVAA